MLQYSKARLSLMMLLQFFIWGAWYATGGNYMKSHGMANVIHLAYTASSIGSIVSPFFLGAIADRFFPVQKVLAIMHILSGIFIFCAPFFAEGSLRSVPMFLIFLLLHMLCYMPTVSLSTATAFHLLKDKEKEFPVIRVFGTLGWIIAGIIVSYVLGSDSTALPMRISGIGGILMGLYCFTLPHIPPPGAGKRFSFRDVIGVDAFKKLRSRSFIIFIVGLLLISVPFASYFTYVPVYINAAGIADPGFKMTFGQMSEVIFLLLLPWFFKKFGLKWVMLAGMLGWTLRYAFFAIAAPGGIEWLIISGILLHGICYDFVYVASQVYIDNKASAQIRAQAQGMFVFIAYGVGQGLGAMLAGFIFNNIMGAKESLEQWQIFWTIPLAFAAIVSLLFVFGFKEKVEVGKEAAVIK